MLLCSENKFMQQLYLNTKQNEVPEQSQTKLTIVISHFEAHFGLSDRNKGCSQLPVEPILWLIVFKLLIICDLKFWHRL